MKQLKISIQLVLTLMILVSCGKSEYTRMVEQEKKKGIKNDSIFLTLKFGDDRMAFYSKCWEQNKKELIKQGPGNMTVEYMMWPPDTTTSPIQMFFFPAFDENDKISKMDVTFRYTGWSPWNTKYSADTLMVAVQDTLENWYGGNKFIKVDFEEYDANVLVKIDGNRKILMAKVTDSDVKVVISDISRTSEAEKSSK